MNSPLSPAVQAVLDAWLSSEKGARMLGDPSCLAAAILRLHPMNTFTPPLEESNG